MNAPKNQRYLGLVVDAEKSRKIRVKTAAMATDFFSAVSTCNDFRTTIEELNSGGDHAAIFISEDFSRTDISEFITRARGTNGGKHAAYIQAVSPKNATQATISGSMLQGLDGLLIEPFSIDSVLEIVQLSLKLHKERKKSSQETAVKHLTTELLKTLDTITTCKAMNKPPGEKLKEMRDISGSISALEPELLEVYLTTLQEETQKMMPPDELVRFLAKKTRDEEFMQKRQARKEEIKQEAIKAARLREEEMMRQRVVKRG